MFAQSVFSAFADGTVQAVFFGKIDSDVFGVDSGFQHVAFREVGRPAILDKTEGVFEQFLAGLFAKLRKVCIYQFLPGDGRWQLRRRFRHGVFIVFCGCSITGCGKYSHQDMLADSFGRTAACALGYIGSEADGDVVQLDL